MTISLYRPSIASMRSINLAATAAIAAVAATGTLVLTGCDPASTQASPPAAAVSVPATASVPAPASTSVPAIATTSPATGTAHAGGAVSGSLIPISVESDSQMAAEGNNGPSSAILLPASCQLTGTTVTAEGTYTNGGFVPNVYDRYGDIIVLYVFTAPSAGEPEGVQLGASDVSESPVLGSQAPWHVSLSITPSVGVPAECVVAAQPTHDEQLAP
jgi:hypothetical protein